MAEFLDGFDVERLSAVVEVAEIHFEEHQALKREPVAPWESVAVLLGVIAVSTLVGVFLLLRQQLDRQG